MMPSLLKRSLYLLLYQKLTETTKKVSDMRNKNDLLPFNNYFELEYYDSNNSHYVLIKNRKFGYIRKCTIFSY